MKYGFLNLNRIKKIIFILEIMVNMYFNKRSIT